MARTLKVLIIDHTADTSVGKMLKRLIEEYLKQTEVSCVPDIDSANNWLYSNRPFMIIMDWPLEMYSMRNLQHEIEQCAQFIWSQEIMVKSGFKFLILYMVPALDEISDILASFKPLGKDRDPPITAHFRKGDAGALQEMMKIWIQAWGKSR